MIEVFKTNVKSKTSAKKICSDLIAILPDSKINFDLEDCDKILRIESSLISSCKIIDVLKNRGFLCKVLK